MPAGNPWRLASLSRDAPRGSGVDCPASAFWPSSWLREHTNLWRARKTSAENTTQSEQTNSSSRTIQLMRRGLRINRGQVTTKWQPNKANPAESQKQCWSIPIPFEFVNILVCALQKIHVVIWLEVTMSTVKELSRAQRTFHPGNLKVNAFG